MSLVSRTLKIDDALCKAVLKRVGKPVGVVEVVSEEWDDGLCETCSFPESGFSVKVDGELVWPNEELLNAAGGYDFADASGSVNTVEESLELYPYNLFWEWLLGEDLEDAYDKMCEAEADGAEETEASVSEEGVGGK